MREEGKSITLSSGGVSRAEAWQAQAAAPATRRGGGGILSSFLSGWVEIFDW